MVGAHRDLVLRAHLQQVRDGGRIGREAIDAERVGLQEHATRVHRLDLPARGVLPFTHRRRRLFDDHREVPTVRVGPSDGGESALHRAHEIAGRARRPRHEQTSRIRHLDEIDEAVGMIFVGMRQHGSPYVDVVRQHLACGDERHDIYVAVLFPTRIDEEPAVIGQPHGQRLAVTRTEDEEVQVITRERG